jgi:hypothetical protein
LINHLSRFFLFLSSFFSTDINANRSLSLFASYVQPCLVLVKKLEEISAYVLMPHIDQLIEEDNWYEWLTLAISVGDVPKRQPLAVVTSICSHVHNILVTVGINYPC